MWRLSTGNSFRSTTAVFGAGKSSAVHITRDFCVIVSKRVGHYIKLPTNERATAIALEKFSKNCKLPQVMGAIDATHIEIIATEDNPTDCFCHKQKYTINTQAVVGADEMFMDIVTGFPGSIHDPKTLRGSKIYQKAESNEILISPVMHLSNQPIRPLIIGDGAYPLKSWLSKPCPYNGILTRAQKKYNRTLSSARSIVERSFWLLKSRRRYLLKHLDDKTCNVGDTIITCCVLHNICQHNLDLLVDNYFYTVLFH